MISRRNKTLPTILISIPVIIIVAGAFTMSVAAVVENLRFVKAADQILALVGSVRSIASQQSGFAQVPGEDVFGDLEKAGQTIPASSHTNSWHGEIRAVTVAPSAMRIETDLLTRDCRRMALYFLGRKPAELGLLTIEAQAVDAAVWTPVDLIASPELYEHLVGSACGKANYARLAVIFRVK